MPGRDRIISLRHQLEGQVSLPIVKAAEALRRLALHIQ